MEHLNGNLPKNTPLIVSSQDGRRRASSHNAFIRDDAGNVFRTYFINNVLGQSESK